MGIKSCDNSFYLIVHQGQIWSQEEKQKIIHIIEVESLLI